MNPCVSLHVVSTSYQSNTSGGTSILSRRIKRLKVILEQGCQTFRDSKSSYRACFRDQLHKLAFQRLKGALSGDEYTQRIQDATKILARKNKAFSVCLDKRPTADVNRIIADFLPLLDRISLERTCRTINRDLRPKKVTEARLRQQKQQCKDTGNHSKQAEYAEMCAYLVSAQPERKREALKLLREAVLNYTAVNETVSVARCYRKLFKLTKKENYLYQAYRLYESSEHHGGAGICAEEIARFCDVQFMVAGMNPLMFLGNALFHYAKDNNHKGVARCLALELKKYR